MLLNIIVNGGIGLLIGIFIFLQQNKSKKVAEARTKARIQNERENWKYFPDLWLKNIDEIDALYKTPNNCAFVMMYFLDKFYIHKSDIDEMKKSFTDKGTPKSFILKTLMLNYHTRAIKPTKTGKNKITVQSILETNDDSLLVVFVQNHVDIIIGATKNKFICLSSDKEFEYDFDYHKILLIESPREIELEEVLAEDEE